MPSYTPDKLLIEFRAGRAPFTSIEFFNRTGMTRLQEMWVAARFSAGVETHIAACEVDIDPVDEQSDTDFRLAFLDKVQPFQVVEVQEQGRKRGLEYQQSAPGSSRLVPVLSNAEAVAQIVQAIQKKADKHYADQASLQLLVYVNLSTLGLECSQIESAVAAAASGFAGVWLIDGRHFACVHQRPPLTYQPGWLALPPEPDIPESASSDS